jgi:RNA polymerase sigma-70 factor (ECF subfamily)
MSERSTEQIRELLDSLYRVDSGRILATLIRLQERIRQLK